MIATPRTTARTACMLAALVILLSSCVQPSGTSAEITVELSLTDDSDIRASSLPFTETAIHVLVAREGPILPRNIGSPQRQRLADALSLRAERSGALPDSPSYAERRAVIDASQVGLQLGGFIPGATYLVTVIASDSDDPDVEPYIAAGRITLETGRNGIRLDLRRNNAAMLAYFGDTYAIDPWSAEFTGLRLAVMDTGNNRALLLTNFQQDGSGWNEIAPSFDDGSPADFMPWQITLADRGRLLLYGELSGQGEDNGPGFLLTNTEGRILQWIQTPAFIAPIKVDRVRGIAYVFDQEIGNRRIDLATGQSATMTIPPAIPGVSTFTVAPNGNLIVLADQGTSLYRYNPVTGNATVAVSDSVDFPLGGNFLPSDMTFVGDTLLLVANSGEGDLVYGIDDTFTFSGSFGSMQPDPSDGEFYGPQRFLDSNAQGAFVADSATIEFSFSRIVGFRNAAGENWSTYGEQGTGIGQFDFGFEGQNPPPPVD